jgi:DEAD/DEAH box helicase domain-containing protein
VIAYQRRRISTQEVIDLVQLDMPETTFETEAVWYVPADDQLDGFDALSRLLGSLHAASTR